MRMLALAVSASLLSCASFAQIPDQTITLAKPLPDSNKDQKVDVSAAGAKRYGVPSKGVWYGPLPGQPNYTYSKVKPQLDLPVPPKVDPAPPTQPTEEPAPEPTPTPAPAPAAGTVEIVNGELFARVGDTVFGGNAYGGLGTLATAPAAFRAAGEKFGRKAFFIDGVDLIVPGAPIDAHTIDYKVGGKAYLIANTGLNLSGSGTVGTWAKDGTWTGQMGCIRKVRAFAFAADGVLLTETLTNTCAQPVTDLWVMIAQDPDNGDTGAQGVTTNKIVAAGSMTAKLASGRTYSLMTDDPRFSAAISPNVVTISGRSSYVFTKPDAVTSQGIGYSVKADSDLILVGKLGALAPGASTSVTLAMGVAAK